MGIEYHGWIALAATNHDWDDGAIEDAFQQVEHILSQLNPEDYHWGILTPFLMPPRMVYVNGSDVDTIEPVKQVIKNIVKVFNASYGELTVLSRAFDVHGSITRYMLVDGELRSL